MLKKKPPIFQPYFNITILLIDVLKGIIEFAFNSSCQNKLRFLQRKKKEHYLFSFKYFTSSFWIYTTDGDLPNSALLI